MRRSEKLFLFFDHLIVLFMRTNPKPDIGIILKKTKYSPSISNSYRIEFSNFFKMERWMRRRFKPEKISFFGENLNFPGYLLKQFSKVRSSTRIQFPSNPPKIVFPFFNSNFASSKIQYKEPLEAKSFLIFSSQSDSNFSSIYEAKRSCSSSDNSLIRFITFSNKTVIPRIQFHLSILSSLNLINSNPKEPNHETKQPE